MIIGGILLCRNNSSRLPGKILRKIQDKPVIEYIWERLKSAKGLDEIVVATSSEPSDDTIVDFCQKKDIKFFRGSLNNVAERFYRCATHFGFDFAVRINGDNLFTDHRMLSNYIAKTREGNYDFISNAKNRTFPPGVTFEIVRVTFFGFMLTQFSTQEHFEHVTLYLYENETQGRRYYYFNSDHENTKEIRLAIDTLADFQQAQKIIASFQKHHTNYCLQEIINILQEKNIHKNWNGKHGPMLIAEIGGNHSGDFNYAKKLTLLAIQADVDLDRLLLIRF